MKYKYFTDPGHGWLKVSIDELESFGIADKISFCSYMKGAYAYLEEDCDMPIFLATKFGRDFVYDDYKDCIENFNTNRSSKIRSYQPYNNRTPLEEDTKKALAKTKTII